jgi:hypothetical protein
MATIHTVSAIAIAIWTKTIVHGPTPPIHGWTIWIRQWVTLLAIIVRRRLGSRRKLGAPLVCLLLLGFVVLGQRFRQGVGLRVLWCADVAACMEVMTAHAVLTQLMLTFFFVVDIIIVIIAFNFVNRDITVIFNVVSIILTRVYYCKDVINVFISLLLALAVDD